MWAQCFSPTVTTKQSPPSPLFFCRRSSPKRPHDRHQMTMPDWRRSWYRPNKCMASLSGCSGAGKGFIGATCTKGATFALTMTGADPPMFSCSCCPPLALLVGGPLFAFHSCTARLASIASMPGGQPTLSPISSSWMSSSSSSIQSAWSATDSCASAPAEPLPASPEEP